MVILKVMQMASNFYNEVNSYQTKNKFAASACKYLFNIPKSILNLPDRKLKINFAIFRRNGFRCFLNKFV